MTQAAVLAQMGSNNTTFRNRIINPGMVIDQRNAGASVTPSAYTYTIDRWALAMSQASKFTVGQNLGSVTPPVGFSNYLGLSTSAAVSVGAGDYFFIRQYIEGFNFVDMAWGTANAKTVTLSFQVYSSLTGTFGGVLTNSAANRSYPFTYTVSSANTWTTASVTIPGDQSGTWIGGTNGIGCSVIFSLGSGSTYSGTAGAWAGANYFSATGATSVVGTNGATWYITGVQLEAGTNATPFEFRAYGTELALCQRYYYNTISGQAINFGVQASTTAAEYYVTHPVYMRAAPTLSYTSLANFSAYCWNGSTGKVPTSMTLAFSTSRKADVQIAWTGAVGAAGSGCSMDANNGDYWAFSAEL